MSAPQESDHLDVMRLLGHMYLCHGRPEQAAAILKALCVLAPDDHRALKSLARASILSGQALYAIQVIDQLLDSGDQTAVLYLLRGQALAALGRPTEAQSALQEFAQARTAELEIQRN